MNIKLTDLMEKHVNELRKYYIDSIKFNTNKELLHHAYLFNAYDALCYYNEYLGGLKHTDKDIIAELLYTAELNICGENTDRPSYIINRPSRCQILLSNSNILPWCMKNEKHQQYLDTLTLPNNYETGLLVLKETRRSHMEQAHYLITKIRAVTFTSFDNQCLEDEFNDYLLECSNREEYDCNSVLEKYSIKNCEEPSINLELAIQREQSRDKIMRALNVQNKIN